MAVATAPAVTAPRSQDGGPLGIAFFDRSVHDVARDLIGCIVAHGPTAG